jgi:hypothetical protein
VGQARQIAESVSHLTITPVVMILESRADADFGVIAE